jgi:hypothetical protein
MSQLSAVHEVHEAHGDALDHLEEEIKALEGVTRWGRWVHWGAAVIVLAAVIAAVVWFVASPPPMTSARLSYLPAAGSPIDVVEPKGATLAEPPSRFAWESVTGRLQYVVRIYVKGTGNPVLERMVTAPWIELTPDERARIPRGNTFIWTVVAQGKDGSTIGAGQATFKVR